MLTYHIGRDPDHTKSRIIVSGDTVSTSHATLSDQGDGTYLLVDAKSKNGTYVRGKNGWREIENHVVRPADEVRFGAVVQNVGDLLARAKHPVQPVPPQPAGKFKFERNPETGEIVKKPI